MCAKNWNNKCACNVKLGTEQIKLGKAYSTHTVRYIDIGIKNQKHNRKKCNGTVDAQSITFFNQSN